MLCLPRRNHRPEVFYQQKVVQSSTVVILLKATKSKSQNRISLKQQRILNYDKSESFLDFHLVYKYICLKIMR